MALVRISQNLLHSVENEINRFAGKVEEETIKPLCPEAATSWVHGGPFFQYCNDLQWGDKKHLRDQLPDEWCSSPNRYDVRIRYTTTDGSTQSISFYVDNAGKRIKGIPGGGNYGPDLVVPQEAAHHIPWLVEHLEKKSAYDAARSVHVSKFSAIRTQVLGFLRGSKSLNDALKKYPDLKLWIPKEFLDSVERVVARTPRAAREKQEQEAAVASIDHTLLASMGVMKAIHSA